LPEHKVIDPPNIGDLKVKEKNNKILHLTSTVCVYICCIYIVFSHSFMLLPHYDNSLPSHYDFCHLFCVIESFHIHIYYCMYTNYLPCPNNPPLYVMQCSGAYRYTQFETGWCLL